MPAFDIGSMCREFLCRCRLGDGEFRIWVAERLTAIYSADTSRLFFSDWFRGGSSESSAPAVCVCREKAALSCGLKHHPDKAPAGINRSGHGGSPRFQGQCSSALPQTLQDPIGRFSHRGTGTDRPHLTHCLTFASTSVKDVLPIFQENVFAPGVPD
jgi:hypothetical protein